MTQAEIEERLLAVEAELRALKARQPTKPNKADPKWVLAHAGRFADDPGFDEVVRLGREYRNSPGTKSKKTTGQPGTRKKSTAASAVGVAYVPGQRMFPTKRSKPPVKHGRT